MLIVYGVAMDLKLINVWLIIVDCARSAKKIRGGNYDMMGGSKFSRWGGNGHFSS